MFTSEEIKDICKVYGISCKSIGDLVDTSFDKKDQRYNYPINDAYFLKINNTKGKNEQFVEEINNLVNRYHSIGVYCPRVLKTIHNQYTFEVKKNDDVFVCHLEEMAKYSISPRQKNVDYDLKKKMLVHVGQLASMYSDIDLCNHVSMWSLITLAPCDQEIDEKQENFNALIHILKENGHREIALKLNKENDYLRDRIKEVLVELPRCVYQGDLNNSNILLDEDNCFKGIIDFNMFGTEVNINCFLNESMYFVKAKDYDELLAQDIYDKMIKMQSQLLSSILDNYKLSDLEVEFLAYYNRIIYMSFYPNVSLMIKLIRDKRHVEKVVELLNMFTRMTSKDLLL